MPSRNLPDDIDKDRLAETALAILSLTLHDGGRVWKGLDWDLMDLLHEKGWILDPQSKAKSVVLTEEGERLAQEFLRKGLWPARGAVKRTICTQAETTLRGGNAACVVGRCADRLCAGIVGSERSPAPKPPSRPATAAGIV